MIRIIYSSLYKQVKYIRNILKSHCFWLIIYMTFLEMWWCVLGWQSPTELATSPLVAPRGCYPLSPSSTLAFMGHPFKKGILETESLRHIIPSQYKWKVWAGQLERLIGPTSFTLRGEPVNRVANPGIKSGPLYLRGATLNQVRRTPRLSRWATFDWCNLP